MELYINNNVNDITYKSELTRHDSWRVKFAQQLTFTIVP